MYPYQHPPLSLSLMPARSLYPPFVTTVTLIKMGQPPRPGPSHSLVVCALACSESASLCVTTCTPFLWHLNNLDLHSDSLPERFFFANPSGKAP